jgi:hypothetical protein
MRDAFITVYHLALAAGADPHRCRAAHGDFFDGNVEIKDSYQASTGDPDQ